ncbi:DivIVA domain-containing protein [Solicola gregarius]|uniref:Cell wall synthesis protein Wag31 n=1 Tax=Solicola gregarius TaxID=2908642 RepID=A0AA46TLQ1_9ACTN|nr:DivIVA domain-containing protein [Solicola gregarius]UYM07428.1 DivIVA domain-containing protein [Solicola gregarius]
MSQTQTSRMAAAIRNARFTVHRNGFDQDEVLRYLDALADTIEQQEQEITTLRDEREANGETAINERAVLMFSEAQKISDNLIDEAVTHARDLMASARTQQREIVKEAQDTAESLVRQSDAVTDDGTVVGYDRQVPEIEYVRTFAKVAQVQLRAVLDALNEQVETLGEVPRLGDQREITRGAFPDKSA